MIATILRQAPGDRRAGIAAWRQISDILAQRGNQLSDDDVRRALHALVVLRPQVPEKVRRDCALATLCGGGCRSENLLYSGDPDVPPCGPWRVRVVSELLAEDRVTALEWPVAFLLAEARARGIETPEDVVPRQTSRHMTDV